MRVTVLQLYGTFILLLIYAFLARDPSTVYTALYDNAGVQDVPSTSQFVQCVCARPMWVRLSSTYRLYNDMSGSNAPPNLLPQLAAP